MKAAVLLATSLSAWHVAGNKLVQDATPMSRVVTLLLEMKSRIEGDGVQEQMSYDKYACWCENSMKTKTQDIADGEKQGKLLQSTITRLMGELGVHGVEIKQLQSDIESNQEAQRDATALRTKQRQEYEAEHLESEQCIGALTAAIAALAAGTRQNFLQASHDVDLLSVAGGIRTALGRSTVSTRLSAGDLALMHKFIEHLSDFTPKAAEPASALQTVNNPFGDYAPQSTVIQGILKEMLDTFTKTLAEDQAAEAKAQSSYNDLMTTKRQELQTLAATLQQHKSDDARKSLERDTSREQLDDTKAKLAADEELFETIKSGCKEKALQWSERSRLRTMELTGVGEAISILSSPEAQKIFTNATTTLLQVASLKKSAKGQLLSTSSHLKLLAQQHHDVALAQLAALAKSPGVHFAEVIAAVDKMIASLRAEEQEDIEHRDRCQRAMNKNEADTQDLNDAIGKSDSKIQHYNQEDLRLRGEISALEGEIQGTKNEMQQILSMRLSAIAEHKQAVKDDTDAIALLQLSITTLARFYKKTGNSVSLAQAKAAPTTSWDGGNYGGRSDETHGIIHILEMLKEDLEKEIKTGNEDDAAAKAQYDKERAALEETLAAQLALKRATEEELLQVKGDNLDENKHKSKKQDDLTAEGELKVAIDRDCTWVASHFQTRRDKRKQEIDGLIDARGYLAGADDGSLV